MIRICIHICLFLALLPVFGAQAQRVNFRLHGSEEVIITREFGQLMFNELTESGLPYYQGGDNGAVIDLNTNQDQIAIFRVEAPYHLDINVDVAATSFALLCNSDCPQEIPELEFQLGWAYWNKSVNNDVLSMPDISELTAQSREILSPTGIPLNFASATFPMRSRSINNFTPPSAPPVPGYDGYTSVPATSAFILVYGRLGDIPESIQSGKYQSAITITASVTTYP